MSGFCRFRQFSRNFTAFSRSFSSKTYKKWPTNGYSKYLIVIGGGLAAIAINRNKIFGNVYALQLRKVSDEIPIFTFYFLINSRFILQKLDESLSFVNLSSD